MKIVIEIDESKLPEAYRTIEGNQNIVDLFHDGLVLLPMEKRLEELNNPQSHLPLCSSSRLYHSEAIEIYTQAEAVGRLLFQSLTIER